MSTLTTLYNLLKETIREWQTDNVSLLAAALAYYTAFALAPLIIVIVAVLGIFLNQSDIQAQIIDEISTSIGSGAADVAQDLINNLTNTDEGLISTVISVVLLLIGALGVFNHFQSALDQIWGVDTSEHSTGIKGFMKDKLISFGMILVIGFLLMVSLALSTAVSVVDRYVLDLLPATGVILRTLNELLAFLVTSALFMAIFKILPHARITWRDVAVGGAMTAFLFTIGRFALSEYLTKGAVASTYGAAGAFVIILLWVYYSAQIVLFGAEFTQVYAHNHGKAIEPVDGKSSSQTVNVSPEQPTSQQTNPH